MEWKDTVFWVPFLFEAKEKFWRVFLESLRWAFFWWVLPSLLWPGKNEKKLKLEKEKVKKN